MNKIPIPLHYNGASLIIFVDTISSIENMEISDDDKYVLITTIAGRSYCVDESYEEILKKLGV